MTAPDPRPITADDIWGDGGDGMGLVAQYSHRIRLLEAKARELTTENERLRAELAAAKGEAK